MHARGISMALAVAGLIGLGAVPAVRADDAIPAAQATGERATPASNCNENALPRLSQPGATPGRRLILIPDNDDNTDRATPGSSGTLLILIPRRAPEATPQAPDTTPEPLPGRRNARTIEA